MVVTQEAQWIPRRASDIDSSPPAAESDAGVGGAGVSTPPPTYLAGSASNARAQLSAQK
jgi:hypothetical protein